MKDIRRRLIAGLALGFLVVMGLVLLGDIQQVASHLARFPLTLVPLILGCTLFNYSLRFIKWHYYLGLIGVRDLPWLESARIFVAGFPLAITPGKVGEALKGVWINQAREVPIARGVTVVLAERISDGLAVLLLSGLGVFAFPRYWPAFAFILGFLILIILVSQIRPLALGILRFAVRFPLLGRWAQALREFYEGTYLLFRPLPTMLAVSLGTIAWLGEGVAMYLVLLGLGVAPGWSTFAFSVFTLSFSTAVGAVSALPGGLGAAEASIAALLALTLHLPSDTSAAATLLIRFATLWFGVALGLIVWLITPRFLVGAAESSQSDDDIAPQTA